MLKGVRRSRRRPPRTPGRRCQDHAGAAAVHAVAISSRRRSAMPGRRRRRRARRARGDLAGVGAGGQHVAVPGRRSRSASRQRRTPARRPSARTTPSGPRTPCSGVGDGSMTVTSAPYSRAAAATSRPIQPAPAITRCPLSRPREARTPLRRSAWARRRVVDARGSAPGRPTTGLAAGRDEQLVVPDVGAVVAVVDGLGGAVDRDDRLRPRCSSMSCRAYQAGSCTQDAVPFLLAEQEALGQRRALVGVVAFVADEDHPAGEALRRSVSAAFAPARPPPTMTNV
ncbi:hypothetical protein SVIOM342S_02378 [Streptomyces violaceorubidus]